MIRKLIIIISIIVVIIYAINPSRAYDGSVHSIINEKVAKEASQLDLVLKTQLGISEGRNAEIEKYGEKKQIWQWIAYGGEAEDFGKDGKYDWLSSRAYNHFHDPLENWADARFNNPVNINYLLRYGRHPVSSIIWGLYPGMQDFSQNTTGNWSWNKARDYYYNALSGLTKDERDQNYADCFRALGQLIHLLQDASVPAHTRNDLHIFPFSEIPFTNEELDEPMGRWTYETYTKENKDYLDYTPSQPGDFPHSDLLADPNPDPNYNNMVPVSGLFDRNMYNEASPIPASNAAIGLAEYSNANFFSQDTIWTYQHPSLDDTNYDTIDWLNHTSVIAEDGKIDNLIYIKKTAGEKIDHLAAADYWSYEYVDDIDMIESPFLIDKSCWKDYANKLVPRAVGYSAALLDYFFRGELEVSVLPLFSENASHGLRVKIKNVTPTQETMIKGAEDQLALVCRYTPDGANADGSEDKFITAASYGCRDGNCNGIQYEEEVTVDFYLPWEEENRIGMQIYESAQDSVKCMLVFKGKLGEEETAVIGKYFTLGQDQIKFNEEWDNGLTGNHPWEHTTADQNPDNGTTSNEIATTDTSSNSLIKDNVRYAGYAEARFNETSVDFNDVITPYTYLQFKIGDLSKTETSTFHWQALVLHFNEGRFLQMTQSGQGYAINGTTATYTFNLGADTNQNIIEMFQNSGISIPDPFYIERIDFVQQLFQESQPTATEDHQHMEVDYIRIIEEKHEE